MNGVDGFYRVECQELRIKVNFFGVELTLALFVHSLLGAKAEYTSRHTCSVDQVYKVKPKLSALYYSTGTQLK